MWAVVWAVVAAAVWVLVLLPGDTDWWVYAFAGLLTVQAVFHLTSWRLWRAEWDE